MDAAEAWLQSHDPEYLKSRQSWKNLDADGEYQTPGQEVPWGDESELAATGRGYVEPVPTIACERCGAEFVPGKPWARFCSEACKKQAARRRAA